jgi:hypothetical protein
MELKRHFESTTTFVPHSSNTKSEDIDHMQQSRWGIIFLGLREGEVLGDLFFCYCIHNNTRKKLNPSLSLPFSQKSKRSESEYLFVFLLPVDRITCSTKKHQVNNKCPSAKQPLAPNKKESIPHCFFCFLFFAYTKFAPKE